MRFLLFVCMLFFSAQMLVNQNKAVNDKELPKVTTEMVDFCELLANQAKYEGKTVRTVAILAYDGEDFIVLYCPQCFKAGVIRPIFTDHFRERTKGTSIGKLPRLKHSSGTVKLIMVGKLSTQQLLIDSVEKATYLSREASFPDRLSPKAKQAINCKED